MILSDHFETAPCLVEARGIEPLSEDQIAAFSPSAVYLLNFPLSAADKRAGDIGSFIVPVLPQSLGRPVPHIDDAACRSRERFGATAALLGSESETVIVSSF